MLHLVRDRNPPYLSSSNSSVSSVSEILAVVISAYAHCSHSQQLWPQPLYCTITTKYNWVFTSRITPKKKVSFYLFISNQRNFFCKHLVIIRGRNSTYNLLPLYSTYSSIKITDNLAVGTQLRQAQFTTLPLPVAPYQIGVSWVEHKAAARTGWLLIRLSIQIAVFSEFDYIIQCPRWSPSM